MSCLASKRVGDKRWKLAATAVAVLLIAWQVRAGTITVVSLPATGTDAATGIGTTNSYLCCIDFGSDSSPPNNINGVPVTHFTLSGANNLFNTTNVIDSNFGGRVVLTSGGPTGSRLAQASSTTQGGTSGNVTNQADGNMRSLLTDLIYVGNSAPINSWLLQEYDNLTIGDQYSLRLYYRQWTSDRLQNVYFNGEGNWQAYSGNPLNEDAGGANYLEYNFTASATNVFCVMTNLVANNATMIYGATLQNLSASGLTGGSITVGNLPATGTDAATGISPTNTYLCCIDFGNSANPPGSINGVPFVHPDLGNQTVNTASGIDSNHGGSYTINTGGSAPCMIAETSSITPSGQADGNTWLMLEDMIYVGSSAPVNSWLNQTYGGLIPGQQYALRIYYRQWAADTRTINVSFNGEETNVLYSGNPLNEDTGGAHYVEYDFIATTTNVFMGMTNLLGNESPMVYGMTLQDNSGPFEPVILQQPSPALAGSSIVFAVAVTGTPTLAYQWYFNTVSNYSGATMTTDGNGYEGSATSSLSATTNLQDYYFVIVTNSYGATTSAIAEYNPLPVITAQPVGGTNAPGTSFDLSVAAGGIPPLAYQWYQNGAGIAGATNSRLGYGYLHGSDGGSYFVVVTNFYGAVTSSVASLVVAGSPPAPPDYTQTDAVLVADAAQAVALAAESDTNQATTNWTAHWIGPASASTNLWLCYRKTFSLSDQPTNAIASIAVDSKYWLWANGQMVVREGELRRAPNPTDTWFDQVNLAPFLQAGSNTIAVLQCFFGRSSGESHTNSGTVGFLFEMNAGGTMVQSDNTWRMITNSAFQLATVVPQANADLPQSSLRYDMRLDLGDWTNADYDDSSWATPTDWGPVGGPPWGKLWLRPVPQWQELPIQDYPSVSISGTNPAVWTCYLPVNEQFAAWLDVSNATGGQIITIVPDSVAVTASPADEYVTTTGRQSFEFPGWISGNLVQYTVPAGVTVYGLGFRPHLFDTQRSGTFDCDNPFFTNLWDKAANTVGVNMMDIWGESRENGNWIGDTSIILGQAPYAFDPMVELLSRKCLLEMIHWQRANLTLFGPNPGHYKELPVQSLAAVGEYGFMRYYRNTGDLAFLQQSYPAIKSYLLNVWQTNSTGFVIHRDGQWDWEDWGNNIDEPLLDNSWYLLALDAAAQIAPLVGQPADAASYLSRAQGIRNQFNASFWTQYGYRSPTNTAFTDERGNAMAVLAGLASPGYSSVLRGILITNQNCSPYMEKYVEEALFKLGYPDDALARMQSRYSAMVSNSVSTLWELFPATGGFNHGWSSGPISLLDENVAGITPTAPGCATFNVQPALGTTLNYANVNVPSPYGMIAISAARDGIDARLSVRVPPGSSSEAFQPDDGGLLSGAVLSIDGGATAVMDDTAVPAEINVANGDATLVTNVESTGTLNKTGGGNLYIGALLSVGAFEVVTGQTIVSVSGQLTATNGGNGQITICPGATLDNEGGSIACDSLNVLGTFEENTDGVLTVDGTVTNEGTMRLLGNAQFNVGGVFCNNGTLDIMTWNGSLPPGFVDQGVVLDRSAIKVESCAVQGNSFNLTLMGYTGHTYQLQYSSNLLTPSWTNMGNAQSGSNAPLVFVQGNVMGNGEGFYRVAVGPAN